MKLFHIAGCYWLGCYIKGRLYLVRRVGRQGDCVRP
jgi:hypothetical protein